MTWKTWKSPGIFFLKSPAPVIDYFLFGVIQPFLRGLRREGGAVHGVTPIVLNNILKVLQREEGGSENGVT